MTIAASVQLEELAPRHAEGLADFFQALVDNGDGSFFYPHPLTADEAKRLCRYSGSDQYFVATRAGQILGYGMLRGWDEGHAVPSIGLATHPAHRNKNIAEQVMLGLIRQATNRGASRLRLTAAEGRDRFIGFCMRHGFVFEPFESGRVIGMLELKPSQSVSTLRIGVCADVLIGWGGGMDLLVNKLRAIKAAKPDSSVYLLVPSAGPGKPKMSWRGFRYAIKYAFSALIGRPRLSPNPVDMMAMRVDELVSRIREFCPTIKICYSAGLDQGLAQVADDQRLDAVYLAMRLPKPRPDCALIGYVPDYQHRHLPHLFSSKELVERDQVFGRLVTASDSMVMNAEAVAKDMRRFTPEPLPGLHVLPFSPNLNPEWLQDRSELLMTYGVNGPYFIVCNQFWMHKDHLTAFRAMAEITRHRPEVSLICTGSTTDYRDPSYFAKLEAEADKLGLGAKLRFLGHIPKRHQIELLKHAVALVQPTLFEGGPGGGSTYEAVALGQRVLLSDLPVNLEADGGDVRFFPCGDYLALAKLMATALDEAVVPLIGRALIAKSEARLRRNGEAIWASIHAAIEARKAR